MTQTADHGETEHMNAPLVAAGGVITTSSGDAIAIMHQHAHLAQERTIHSCGQMEHMTMKDRQSIWHHTQVASSGRSTAWFSQFLSFQGRQWAATLSSAGGEW